MKKFILLRLLSVFVFASSCNFSMLAVGESDDIGFPDYTIEAPWKSYPVKSEKCSKDLPDDDCGKKSSNNVKDKISDNCTYQRNLGGDYEQSLFAKLKSKLPHVSKELIKDFVKIVLVLGFSGVAFYFGYKYAKIVSDSANAAKIKNITEAVSKAAAV